MKPVLAAADVAVIEHAWADNQAASDTGSTWPLMLAAGRAIADRVAATAPRGPIWILAGKGNNGGDGYVAAWHLRQAGFNVELIAPLGPSRSGGDADRARQQWLVANPERSDLPATDPDVVVDALLGTGQHGRIAEALARVLRTVNSLDTHRLAVDVPSGLNAQSGRSDPAAFKAHQTLSFIAFKPGLLTGDGPDCVGRLELETLELDASHWAEHLQLGIDWYLDTAPAWPGRLANAHKGRFGQVSVVAGSAGMGGAGLLAARAALAAGAGKVVWHTSSNNAQAALVAQPELMSAALTEQAVPVSAIVVLGPGLGRDAEAVQLCDRLTADGRAGVMDADGLNCLARHPKKLPGWVLTPHPGEAAALLGITSANVQADRCEAARQLSQRYQAVVVLKGAGSLIAHQGQLWFGHPGTVAMATPGMGDTLAGWIGGLMAQGFSAQAAAVTATWWHAAMAADLSREQRIVLATDLLPLIQAARLPSHAPGH